MPKYLIEREIPGAAKLSAQELQAISQKLCAILDKMGSQIQWLQSYVTDEKVYCIYIASSEEVVREHARQGRIPGGSDFRDKDHDRSHNSGIVIQSAPHAPLKGLSSSHRDPQLKGERT